MAPRPPRTAPNGFLSTARPPLRLTDEVELLYDASSRETPIVTQLALTERSGGLPHPAPRLLPLDVAIHDSSINVLPRGNGGEDVLP